ncbi:hypothetical protein [Actinosynnema pretiosum]|uniref:Uncharacterized protein n=2 Tax=Actinosynnema pretiosum TaxID=42197 RepID=A0A290ZEU2_9PSEU|nr:hypothetical protein [Actinosynnema pretiosum]ATE53627.1 hypothetical protein CNX65_10260 [Actinosynnema pretiosum]ATE57489.1 hypothetical protein CNX65_32735 [Actinosynnema pretiosum]
MKDLDVLNCLRGVFDALDAANAGRRELGHTTRDRLVTALEHLATVMRGTRTALRRCGEGARQLAETTEHPDLAELAHEFETATTPLVERAATALRAFETARDRAQAALRTRAPGPGKYGPTAGEQSLAMLADAADLMDRGFRPVLTPAGLEQATDELERIASLTAELAHALADAAHRLAQVCTTKSAAEAQHRNCERVHVARMRTSELDRALVPLGVLAGRLHELDARDRDA